jgi:glycosyltransferase involved in cell wall biosynthesis
MDLSLCMIVKNEEASLPQALSSVKDIVDEMVILDTGSSDRTVEIAREFGSCVYHFDWCNDFSAARNEAVKYVQGSGYSF